MNIDMLLGVLSKIECPEKVTVDVEFNLENKVGLAHFIEIKCTICDWKETFCTSRKIKSSKGQSSYEINRTSIIAFRESGIG